MRQMAFKKAYIEPILDGRKTQTLRARTSHVEGDIIRAMCHWGKPPFAYLEVTGVEPVALAEITDDMACADGYDDAEDLKTILVDLYPGVRTFFRIAFRPVAPETARELDERQRERSETTA